MEYLYSFTVALFLTIALIPLLIRFSEKLQLVDKPGADRKIHNKVMPRSGGIAIIAGVFIPLIFTLALDQEMEAQVGESNRNYEYSEITSIHLSSTESDILQTQSSNADEPELAAH